jgi:hypothetical protein
MRFEARDSTLHPGSSLTLLWAQNLHNRPATFNQCPFSAEDVVTPSPFVRPILDAERCALPSNCTLAKVALGVWRLARSHLKKHDMLRHNARRELVDNSVPHAPV